MRCILWHFLAIDVHPVQFGGQQCLISLGQLLCFILLGLGQRDLLLRVTIVVCELTLGRCIEFVLF